MQLPALADSAGEELCKESEAEMTACGDMAAAHSGWVLDFPVARRGCCFYCWLRKPDWFDVEKIVQDSDSAKSAPRDLPGSPVPFHPLQGRARSSCRGFAADMPCLQRLPHPRLHREGAARDGSNVGAAAGDTST
eukprot:2311304-Pleurochrysis_carterae.AAC.1